MFKDTYNLIRHWEVIDTIFYPNGNKETRKYFNTVVDDCSKVLAGLMKGKEAFSGVKYWAVGSGNPQWSDVKSPVPSVTDARLTKETFRKAIPPKNIIFIDNSNEPSNTVTNKLQITLEFTEEEANGELREFGLFGGDATASLNSGLMINHKIHPLIYKTSGMKIQRVIRMTF